MILAPSLASASGRYDPRLRFQTISTTRFDIHYHQGEEPQARRLARLAEIVAAELDATLGRPSGRVQVILVDQSDLSNGWATPLPFNTIEIAVASPAGSSLIGNTDDWLRLVFVHEYTHVVHLSRGRGWIGGLRRVFGRMPLLYPNLYLPLWQIEGIAVHEESALTGQGRVPDRNFRAIADVASAESRFEPIDRANGGLVDWPSGQAQYVYGAYFHEFLVARYGEASLRQLTDSTAGRVPYFGSRAFKKIFKRSLGDLWREFEAASREPVAAASAKVKRLTEDGFGVAGPRLAARRPLVLLGREPQWLSGAARPRARRHRVAKGHQSIPRHERRVCRIRDCLRSDGDRTSGRTPVGSLRRRRERRSFASTDARRASGRSGRLARRPRDCLHDSAGRSARTRAARCRDRFNSPGSHAARLSSRASISFRRGGPPTVDGLQPSGPRWRAVRRWC